MSEYAAPVLPDAFTHDPETRQLDVLYVDGSRIRVDSQRTLTHADTGNRT
jgi:hypothetical protein